MSMMSSNTSVSVPQYHSRFQEGSIDGPTNPPSSPQPISPLPTSPPLSPRISPSKDKGKDSPSKGSPARAKFEFIAEMVGIKAANGKEKEQGSESSSPQGKRRWRDVWRTGSRRELSKDETPQAP